MAGVTYEERVKRMQRPDNAGRDTTLQGISQTTRDNLNYYGQGYEPSENVKAARDYLDNVIKNRPKDFQSSYQGQISSLYDQIMNRPKFNYDLAKDPLFQQYKNQYQLLGQQAMRDTVGNAAALTGGYGNTWATTAGSMAYQDYLQKMNDIIPTLYRQARDNYTQEGQELQNRLTVTKGLEDSDYGKYRDTLGDWQNDRNYAQGAYGDEYQREYNAWMDMLNYYQKLANAENEDFYNYQQYLKSLGQGGRGGDGDTKKKTGTRDTGFYDFAEGRWKTYDELTDAQKELGRTLGAQGLPGADEIMNRLKNTTWEKDKLTNVPLGWNSQKKTGRSPYKTGSKEDETMNEINRLFANKK